MRKIRSCRRIGDSKGANLVEAAIITPLLLLLTFAIVDFASMFYVYLALENGVSQATRFAVTGNAIGTLSREDSVKTAMRQATPTLTLPDNAFSFQYMPQNGTNWIAGIGGPSDIGKVTVTYNWQFFTPLIRPFFGTNGTITMRVDSVMRNERMFP
jgi:Flp pilus assembly protein TadG